MPSFLRLRVVLTYTSTLTAIWVIFHSHIVHMSSFYSHLEGPNTNTDVIVRIKRIPSDNFTQAKQFENDSIPNETNVSGSGTQIAVRFLDICPQGLKRQAVKHKHLIDDLDIIQTEVQMYGDDFTAVMFHGIWNRRYAYPKLYCHLWVDGSKMISGLVSRSTMKIFDNEPNTIERLVSFICGFPMDEGMDLSVTMAALVPEPCVHPTDTVRLSEAQKKRSALNLTDLTEVIKEEAPPWRDKATYVFSNSSSIDINTHTCFHERKKMTIYDVIKPSIEPDWITIERRVSYIYSAHVDLRANQGVLIKGFGIINRGTALSRAPLQLICQLMVRGNRTPYLAGVDIIDILSGRRVNDITPRYRDVIFQCVFSDLKVSDLVDPVLSYVSEPCSRPSNFIHVTIPVVRPEQDRAEFMVCLSGPINSKYDNYNRLVEWMELNLLLGTEHVVMYNHEAGETLGEYLRYYQNLNRLSVHRWDIPEFINGSNNRDVWYYAQRILINDCMYRYMYRAKYLVFMDFDELIAPKAPATAWRTMLAQSVCARSAYTMVINVVFRTDWPDDIKTTGVPIIHELELITLLKTARENKPYPMNKHGKYIIKPTEIDMLLVHRPYPRDPEKVGPCILPPDVGVLHHYREPFVHSEENVADSLRDRSLHHFAESLISNAQWVHSQVRLRS